MVALEGFECHQDALRVFGTVPVVYAKFRANSSTDRMRRIKVSLRRSRTWYGDNDFFQNVRAGARVLELTRNRSNGGWIFLERVPKAL